MWMYTGGIVFSIHLLLINTWQVCSLGNPLEDECVWDSHKHFSENILCLVSRQRRQTRSGYEVYGHPCTNYIRLLQPERRVGYRINQMTDNALCDRTLKRRWYRFDGPAGGIMPESCVEEFNCGTHAPIWLNGDHPLFYGETLDLPVCVSLMGDCCERTWYIRVANCGDFYTYLLTDTPGCFMAYCAGRQEPCEPGQSSVTGFTPGCSDNFPKLNGGVELYVGEEGHLVAIYCDYDGAIPVGSYIETEWFVQGDNSGPADEGEFPVFVDSMRGRRRSILEEGHWYGKMGSSIYCRMRARWFNRTGVPSPYMESEKYFAGIKISKRVVEVGESDTETTIQIQSTMPVTCLPQFRDACKVTVELAHDQEVGGKMCIDGKMQQVVFGDCSIDITPDNWRDVHNVTVKAVRDFYHDGTKLMRVNFKPVYSTLGSGLWNDYVLPDVEVIAKDGPNAMCSSTGDPHYNTFDGLYYHVYLEGEFVLYKNTRMPLQINTRLEKCGKTVSCNCAVAVKAADDVIVIDRCQRRKRNLAYGSSFPEGWNSLHRHALEQGDEFVNGLKLFEHDSGKRYTVHLPTGAYIDFRIGEHWVNIYLHASSDDWRSTRGLCGTFDEDRSNDFLFPDGFTQVEAVPHEACGESENVCRFAEAWRVAREDSFFGPVVEVPVEEYEFMADRKYCKCEKTGGQSSISCNYHYDVHNCQAVEQKHHGVDKTEEVLIRSSSGSMSSSSSMSRFRRDTSNTDTSDEFQDYFDMEFIYSETYRGQVPQWPTPSGITESYARSYCYDVITRSEASRVCNTLTHSKRDVIIDECMTDIKVTDDLSWALASLSTFTEECSTTIHETALYWQTTDQTNYESSQGAGLLVQVCQAGCSQHGTCYQGECRCRHGYEGEACSTLIYQSLQVFHVGNYGLCDASRQPCSKLRVLGANFRNTSDLLCHFRDTDDQMQSMSAIFVTFEELWCPLPQADTGLSTDTHRVAMTTYNMYLTQNGYHSNDTTVVTYNSHCFMCDITDNTLSCGQKEQICLIDGVCYSSAERNPDNCCEMCDPDLSADQFSPIRGIRPVMLFPRQSAYELYLGDTWRKNLKAFGGSGCRFEYFTSSSQTAMFDFEQRIHDVAVTFHPTETGTYLLHVTAQDPCDRNISRSYTINVIDNPSPNEITSCEGNSAPEFDNETLTYFMVPNERLALQMLAMDVDSDSVEYHVLKSSPSTVSISKDGMLSYQAGDDIKTDVVKVFATDSCGRQDYVHVVMVIRRCMCSNGGTCTPIEGTGAGSGEYICVCPAHFTGQWCELPIQ